MKDFTYIIREIKAEDKLHICKLIRDVLVELKLPLVGTTYQDDETESIYQSYQNKNERYFVIDSNGQILDEVGIKALNQGNENTCELQKMCFSKNIRGLGLGKKMLERCLVFTKISNYNFCYFETIN